MFIWDMPECVFLWTWNKEIFMKRTREVEKKKKTFEIIPWKCKLMTVHTCFVFLKTCRNKIILSYSRLWEMRLKTFCENMNEMVRLYCQQTSLKHRLHMCNDNFNSMILKHERIFKKEMLLYEN
jgi:hypothetical protein